LKREIIKIEAADRQYEFYARPTILEEQMIRDRAAGFTGGGLSKLIEVEAQRNIYLDKCIKRDDSGKPVEGSKEGSIKLDTSSMDYKMYAEYQRTLDNAYFYGIFKTLLVNPPDDLNIDELDGITFMEIRSVFEDALDNFRKPERDTETEQDNRGNPRVSEPAAG